MLHIQKLCYEYDIEGKQNSTKEGLHLVIQDSYNSSVLSNAYFYLGKIYDHEKNLDSAVHFFQKALKEQGLFEEQLTLVFRRLIEINPELAQPITREQTSIIEVGRVFSFRKNKRRQFIIQSLPQQANNQETAGNYMLLNSQGIGGEFTIPHTDKEYVLDATSDFYLVGNQNSVRLGAYQVPPKDIITDGEDIASAHFLSSEKSDFIILLPHQLNVYHNGVLQSSISHEGSSCTWHEVETSPEKGFLFCDDRMLYYADFNTEEPLNRITSLSGKLFFVSISEHAAILQYQDRFEIRSGKNYATTRWTSHSKLSDKIYLTKNTVLLQSDNGDVKCYNATSGQKMWQQNYAARTLYPSDDNIYMLTHYHAFAGVGMDGKINWQYEFGWNNEVSPFLLDGYLVIHLPAGLQIKLNLDLMRIASTKYNEKLSRLINQMSDGDKDDHLYAEKILKLEPGNGLAWKFNYLYNNQFKQTSQAEQFTSLVQAARSFHTAPWQSSPVLDYLNQQLKSSWIWKRSYGPKYYPKLIPRSDRLLYIENNNQTLTILSTKSGQMLESIHIPEELDSKICFWKNDTILVSSPEKLYLVPPDKGVTGTEKFSLKKPVCDAVISPEGLFISDWFGQLSRLEIPGGFHTGFKWTKQISENGLLLRKPNNQKFIDALDIKGHYYAINPENGSVLFDFNISKGTITAVYSFDSVVITGFDDGVVICKDKHSKTTRWRRNFSNQIFSLDGVANNLLLITTATKQLFCVNIKNGKLLSETNISTPIVNTPTITNDGYWLSTTEPALEKRTFDHQVVQKYLLTDFPGNPVLHDKMVFLCTLDGFIAAFSRNKDAKVSNSY
ncbi:MAG: PQQ-binding-like beta-propeller repeat protein [Fibrobacteria bacterium]|nr:PQQ-binding-like beta-propeller repeat protein [Fibrobacteria bacterium]